MSLLLTLSWMENSGRPRSLHLVRLRTARDGDDRCRMNCRKSETTRFRRLFGYFFGGEKVSRRRNRGLLGENAQVFKMIFLLRIIQTRS